MSKRVLWIAIAGLFLILVGIWIYSDYFGNVKMQENTADLLKLVVGAFIGAWANEVAK